jgi:hypothetical protein
MSNYPPGVSDKDFNEQKIDKQKTLILLRARQNAIEFESDEDEGAAEHYSEIQSVIDAIDGGQSDKQIFSTAEMVGLVNDLRFT